MFDVFFRLQVLITAHIPPGIHTPNGFSWMYPEYNGMLVNILRRHASTIVGMHFGHDHSDEFKILPDVQGSTPFFLSYLVHVKLRVNFVRQLKPVAQASW